MAETYWLLTLDNKENIKEGVTKMQISQGLVQWVAFISDFSNLS